MSRRPGDSQSRLGPDVGVVALVADEWGPHWQPRHQVLTRLARQCHVAWVSPARSWRVRLTRPAGSANRSATQPTAPVPEMLHIIGPADGWPAVKHPAWLANAFFDARVRAARAALHQRGCTRIVLYLWYPDFARALDTGPHDLSLYHIDDEYSWSETERPVDPAEHRLIERVDRVIIHSPGLMERKGSINPRTIAVPNGVDYAAYSSPSAEPADLAGIPHPRIGYAGVLKTQLDWGLLGALARAHADWSFVFVGPMKSVQHELASAMGDILDRPNVHWLGARPADRLHAYQQHFDVCTMPYRRSAYTDCIYPLKLHESLATGRPTIGTRIRTLRDFADVVTLADTPAEWGAAIEASLTAAANSREQQEARRNVARRHDWDILVDRIASEIADALGDDRDTPIASEIADALRDQGDAPGPSR